MTVAELIEQLKKQDPGHLVYGYDDGSVIVVEPHGNHAEVAYIETDFYKLAPQGQGRDS